jgi:hypothetical protein
VIYKRKLVLISTTPVYLKQSQQNILIVRANKTTRTFTVTGCSTQGGWDRRDTYIARTGEKECPPSFDRRIRWNETTWRHRWENKIGAKEIKLEGVE